MAEARQPHYYEAYGEGTDAIARCFECRRLVTDATLLKHRGRTPCCGTRRLREVRALSKWEWLKIWVGWINFPHRQEFLAEFRRG